MKIVDKRVSNAKCFAAVNTGDTFMYENEIYMKVSASITRDGCNFNTIMLGLGRRVQFNADELVIPVKCELHIVD